MLVFSENENSDGNKHKNIFLSLGSLKIKNRSPDGQI
jgi:hypothetical protein